MNETKKMGKTEKQRQRKIKQMKEKEEGWEECGGVKRKDQKQSNARLNKQKEERGNWTNML